MQNSVQTVSNNVAIGACMLLPWACEIVCKAFMAQAG
jgi:hypothetical protein